MFMDFLKTLTNANKNFEKGEYEKAFEYYLQIMEQEPNLSVVSYLAGMCKYNLNKPIEAIRYFDKYISDVPNDYRGYYSKAMCLFSECQFDSSLYFLLKAHELEEKNVDVNFMISICLIFLNRPESEDYLNTAKEIDAKRTKELLNTLYDKFFKNNEFLTDEDRQRLKEKIEKL